MHIRKTNWIYRLYTFDKCSYQLHNTLNMCDVFWNCLFKLVAVSILLAPVGMMIYAAFLHPRRALEVIAILLGVAAFVFGSIGALYTFDYSSVRDFVQMVKGKYCPTLDVKD